MGLQKPWRQIERSCQLTVSWGLYSIYCKVLKNIITNENIIGAQGVILLALKMDLHLFCSNLTVGNHYCWRIVCVCMHSNIDYICVVHVVSIHLALVCMLFHTEWNKEYCKRREQWKGLQFIYYSERYYNGDLKG